MAMAMGINPFDHGSEIHTDLWRTQGLKQALIMHGFDAAFGGGRRDEEKSQAKERIFSFRTLGCYPLTGAMESDARTLPAVIHEMLLARSSERQGRAIDGDGGASRDASVTASAAFPVSVVRHLHLTEYWSPSDQQARLANSTFVA